jgi:glycerol kinase
MERGKADEMYGRWDDAVERSLDWAEDEGAD